jgi:hypothetical protein
VQRCHPKGEKGLHEPSFLQKKKQKNRQEILQKLVFLLRAMENCWKGDDDECAS